MENHSVGQRIRALRRSKRLTQAQLAKIAGVSAPAVTEWEKDGYLPKSASLNAIADYFNVTPDFILTGDGDFQPSSINSEVRFSSIVKSFGKKNSEKNYNTSGLDDFILELEELDNQKKLTQDVIKHLRQTLQLITKP